MLLVKLKVPRGVLFISSLSHQNTSWGFLRPKVLNAFPSTEHFCKTNHLQPCLHQLVLFFLAAFCLHIATIADEWNRMKVGNLHRLHAPSLYCCPLQSAGMCITIPTCSHANKFLRAQLVVINSTSAFKTMLQLKVNMILLSSWPTLASLQAVFSLIVWWQQPSPLWLAKNKKHTDFEVLNTKQLVQSLK